MPSGRPSNRNPPCTGCQITGTPVVRDWARADSNKAESRSASRSSCEAALSRIAKLTPALAMAMIATTTSNSIRVKPAGRRRAVRIRVRRPLLPGADVRILALASRLSIGAQRHDVDLALHARIEVLVRPSPRVRWELVQVRLPVGRDGGGAWLGDERLQPLLGSGVALVVQAIELQGLHQVVHVGARGRRAS